MYEGRASVSGHMVGYPIGCRVYVKRSNGEENIAFVTAYDEKKNIYTKFMNLLYPDTTYINISLLCTPQL